MFNIKLLERTKIVAFQRLLWLQVGY